MNIMVPLNTLNNDCSIMRLLSFLQITLKATLPFSFVVIQTMYLWKLFYWMAICYPCWYLG